MAYFINLFLFHTSGAGACVKCVETVVERPPVVMGKPSKNMFSLISEKHKLEPSRTLMIGDRLVHFPVNSL